MCVFLQQVKLPFTSQLVLNKQCERTTTQWSIYSVVTWEDSCSALKGTERKTAGSTAAEQRGTQRRKKDKQSEQKLSSHVFSANVLMSLLLEAEAYSKQREDANEPYSYTPCITPSCKYTAVCKQDSGSFSVVVSLNASIMQ